MYWRAMMQQEGHTNGEQLADTHANIAQHKAVDAKDARRGFNNDGNSTKTNTNPRKME
jgi:hypothetical protein